MVPGQYRASKGPARGGRGHRRLHRLPGARSVPGVVAAALGRRPAWCLGRPDLRRPRAAAPPVARRPPRRCPGLRIRGNCPAAVPPAVLAFGEGQRRSVSADISNRGPATRGQLRIYLGCAPGAGTTCALLREGRLRAEHGTGVVVASVETHGRPGTEVLLAGLEVISPPAVAYRGTAVEGIDLAAILARSPQVALVDDLAHSNAPGARHAARWQEVEDLLAAGIDVISNVSVAHLESLSDVVAKITGVAPQRTVPDPVIRAADEVQLVDIAPEVLRDRMARGHIYPPQQAAAALGGWCRTGNLAALRELALLWLAAALAKSPRWHRGGHDLGRGQARERVVVALSGGLDGETLIRRAARIAARCGADLMAVHAAPPGGPAATVCAALADQRRLTESLGGSYHQLAAGDIPTALLA